MIDTENAQLESCNYKLMELVSLTNHASLWAFGGTDKGQTTRD